MRCEALVQRTFELFPDAGDRESAQFWTGLRPATPSNVPLIGRHALPQPVPRHRATARWAGRWPAARAGRSPTSIAGRKPGVDFAFTGRGDHRRSARDPHVDAIAASAGRPSRIHWRVSIASPTRRDACVWYPPPYFDAMGGATLAAAPDRRRRRARAAITLIIFDRRAAAHEPHHRRRDAAATLAASMSA